MIRVGSSLKRSRSKPAPFLSTLKATLKHSNLCVPPAHGTTPNSEWSRHRKRQALQKYRVQWEKQYDDEISMLQCGKHEWNEHLVVVSTFPTADGGGGTMNNGMAIIVDRHAQTTTELQDHT